MFENIIGKKGNSTEIESLDQRFNILLDQLIRTNQLEQLNKEELSRLRYLQSDNENMVTKFMGFIRSFIESKTIEIASFDGNVIPNQFYKKTPRRKEYRVRCSDCRQDIFVHQWENLDQIPRIDWKYDGTEEEGLFLHLLLCHKELWQ